MTNATKMGRVDAATGEVERVASVVRAANSHKSASSIAAVPATDACCLVALSSASTAQSLTVAASETLPGCASSADEAEATLSASGVVGDRSAYSRACSASRAIPPRF